MFLGLYCSINEIYPLYKTKRLQSDNNNMEERMMRLREAVAFWLLVVVAAAMPTCTVSQRHDVGGPQGWTQNVNYTVWASQEHIYVGEWLYFRFDKHYYNVLEVNKTNYEQCNDREFITNITRGGRDVYQLKEARPYYFISSGGYCYHGMKLAIDVKVKPAPTLAPAKSDSPISDKGSLLVLIVMLAIALACMVPWSVELLNA